MTSMDDYEIKRTVWESKVPIEFTIDSEMMLSRRQHSSFVMLPRVSYFSLYLSKAQLNLMASGLEDNAIDDIWLVYNGEPLKWHYPIGVLYDMFVNDDQSLPWVITIKTKDFPKELIRCQSKKTLQNCFFQSLKEADQLKHKCNVMFGMNAEERAKLFDSLVNGRFDDFWSVNKKLMADDEKQKFLYVPIRFYQPAFPFRQVLIPQQDDAGVLLSLGDALEKAFPEQRDTIGGEDYVAISHGIPLPLCTPVAWLSRNASYPDNFVHIVWRKRQSTEPN